MVAIQVLHLRKMQTNIILVVLTDYRATAIYGTAVKNGAQIAVDEINAAGGINGKQIEYRFEDDQNDAEKAVNAYNTLKTGACRC